MLSPDVAPERRQLGMHAEPPADCLALERFSFAHQVSTDNRTAGTKTAGYDAIHQCENRSRLGLS